MTLPAPLWPVLAFALGAIPFGVLVARQRGLDLRQHGSGNIGATNAARVMGVGPGLVVLVLDAAKGAAPTWLAQRAGVDVGWVAAAGLAAVLGHCFSPWLRFRGGKGVATALGVDLILLPLGAATGAAVFVLVLALTRIPALGSLAAAWTIAGYTLATSAGPALIGFTAAIAVLLVYTHRSNLAGLRARWRARRADPEGESS
ncbi:MAG: glycerol-3-phosphate 1-O-acyltransferase PlsY [Kofleriaceae bacterium]|jgi:glycerol-3-phosphate acyltransferase PlsY|nr:glycerol-3-phosphate 1-O-acyltransferase PlsY [Kofleriaceae bacterium]MBP6840394.1 glycerol-3-phosphate 1-O-acyltransferase PlsY [Kofleriaceae bacterium]